MESHNLMPSREEAEQLLAWAYQQNPGPWTDHCKVVARIAETIARNCNLDIERAYVSGLLHDIGYYSYRNGEGGTCPIFAGYELMIKKGYLEVAEICLSHSFPYRDARAYGGSDMNCTNEETAVLVAFLSEKEYNDYDKLIQLCDNLGTAQGICIMEKRMLDVTMRHGFDEFTIKRWSAFFTLKDHFDKKCDRNIYGLFHDEIAKNVFA